MMIEKAAIPRGDCRVLARRLGLTVNRSGMTTCFSRPDLHANRDATPSTRIHEDGFYCFGCHSKGDAIDLVRHVTGCGFRDAVGKLEELFGPVGPQRPGSNTAPSTRHPVRRRRINNPPSSQVDALWSNCCPVSDLRPVVDWLQSRSLDVAAVEDDDLIRGLPADTWRYAWAPPGHQAVVPVFDENGELATLRFRPFCGGKPRRPKELAARGFGFAGVLANPLARLMLAGRSLGDGTSARNFIPTVGLLIAEGCPDFLTWCCNWNDGNDAAPAVLGILAGSWTQAFADQVPDGTTVTVATHHDDGGGAGERFARDILTTLACRQTTGLIKVHRWTQGRAMAMATGATKVDANDILRSGARPDASQSEPYHADGVQAVRALLTQLRQLL